ncbi:hypothetical protein MHYP_G00032380, partial [Metynnis hypsauchen]
MYRELISVAILATFLQLGNTYSFRNCIEAANSNHTIFKCANHQKDSVKDIVDDVLLSATNVTINFCTLSHIPSGSFSHLPKLEVLTLNHNYVGTISKDAFVNLTYLQTLNLSSNNISYFSPYLFRGLHNLTELFLADDRLTYLSQDFFTDLINLNTL